MDNLEQLNLYFNSRKSNHTLSYISDANKSTDAQLSSIKPYLDISDLDSISIGSWGSGRY